MAKEMTVKVEGDELVIRVPLQKPEPSKTGKTLVVASSKGNKTTEAEVETHPGKKIVVGVNAYIKP
jgi:hypothetical protein